MEICKCGHPKERHTFQIGVCTVRPPNKVGNGAGYCRCNQYAKDTIESAKITSDILSKPKT